MTARVWTKARLDEVHPLPKADGKRHLYPWAWRVDDDGPVAFEVGPSEPEEVWCSRGRLESGTGSPPDDVAIAVILASMGRDSVASLADALDTLSESAATASGRAARDGARKEGATYEGERRAYSVAAIMVRRGTVAP